MHNITNALAAIAAAVTMGFSLEDIKQGLLNYDGTDRRFEYKGSFNGTTVIDDYAHHPTEIAATLTTAQKCPHKTLWCVFQPHTYTRTKAFLNDFAKALSWQTKLCWQIFSRPGRQTLATFIPKTSRDCSHRPARMSGIFHHLQKSRIFFKKIVPTAIC